MFLLCITEQWKVWRVVTKLTLTPFPGYLNFWKVFVQIPPSRSGKAVQMPPPSGKLPDYCFNFSEASEAVYV